MQTQRIEAAVRQAVADGVVAGIVLAAQDGYAGRWMLAAGSSTLFPKPEPMRRDTIFDLASLTKVLATTTVVMRMLERGELDLDRPLRDISASLYLGSIGLLTPRLLLTHSAGFPASIAYYRDADPHPADPEGHREAALQRVRTTELVYEPGKESRYSDIGMMLMGDVIEQTCQKRLDHVFERYVASPLKLTDTFFRHLDYPLAKAERPAHAFAATEQCAWRGELVRGQVHDENAYLLRGVAGHAGLFATAGDIMTLAGTLLACYHGEDAFLQAATVRHFVSRQNLVPGSDRAVGWGTPTPGASCGAYFSSSAFGHTGFTGTSLWVDPEPRRLVLLFSNRVHPSRDNTAFLRFRPRLHDLIVGP